MMFSLSSMRFTLGINAQVLFALPARTKFRGLAVIGERSTKTDLGNNSPAAFEYLEQ